MLDVNINGITTRVRIDSDGGYQEWKVSAGPQNLKDSGSALDWLERQQ